MSAADSPQDHTVPAPMPSGQIDAKGRLSIPRAMRDKLGLRAGDTVFFTVDYTDDDVPYLRMAKAVNPLAMMLDALAEDAIRAYERGETIPLEQAWAELDEEDAAQRGTHG